MLPGCTSITNRKQIYKLVVQELIDSSIVNNAQFVSQSTTRYFVCTIRPNKLLCFLQFFLYFGENFQEINITGKPHFIFICNETSFLKDPCISKSGRDNKSMLLCCSAPGQKLHLLCIFNGENIF